jgi:hypothetical protein
MEAFHSTRTEDRDRGRHPELHVAVEMEIVLVAIDGHDKGVERDPEAVARAKVERNTTLRRKSDLTLEGECVGRYNDDAVALGKGSTAIIADIKVRLSTEKATAHALERP